MKKCILSALAGAMAMLIAIALMATIHANKVQQPKDYQHIDYISSIAAERRFFGLYVDGVTLADGVGSSPVWRACIKY